MRHIDIATEYAKGWNNLNFTNFFECLDADCELSSYWVLSNLKGKLAIADYLNKKVETIKRANHKVYAELGTCTVTEVGSPCVVLAQSDPANREGVVTFKINSNLVTEMNICAFQILAPNCSGIYPK